jgi:hypothetical protein
VVLKTLKKAITRNALVKAWWQSHHSEAQIGDANTFEFYTHGFGV